MALGLMFLLMKASRNHGASMESDITIVFFTPRCNSVFCVCALCRVHTAVEQNCAVSEGPRRASRCSSFHIRSTEPRLEVAV